MVNPFKIMISFPKYIAVGSRIELSELLNKKNSKIYKYISILVTNLKFILYMYVQLMYIYHINKTQYMH